MKKNYISALAVLACVAVFCTISGNSFHQMRTATEEIIPGEGVTEVRMLSDYFPDLAGTAGDTQIYVLQGEQEGGSCLILGGTHANELGGHMGAVLFVENANAVCYSPNQQQCLYAQRPPGRASQHCTYHHR